MASLSTMLWWGRFDKEYSRNRILRGILSDLGWRIIDFRPNVSSLASLEALLRRVERPDLIWVPCFRQRDIPGARRWARRKGVPLLIDPLISAYDKQVYEKHKYAPENSKAKRLLKWEQDLFQSAELVLADTHAHAAFFQQTLGVDESNLCVVPVGAEEALFRPSPDIHSSNDPLQVLFCGSFIPLQGVEVIAEAVCCYRGAPVDWTFLGEGPLLTACKTRLEGRGDVRFIPWVPYTELPGHIRGADILLGVFGATPKARRVIPNKVFQSLACGRPVVTGRSDAYPQSLLESSESGLKWCGFDDPQALAEAVASLAAQPESLPRLGKAAYASYSNCFSNAHIGEMLAQGLERFSGRF